MVVQSRSDDTKLEIRLRYFGGGYGNGGDDNKDNDNDDDDDGDNGDGDGGNGCGGDGKLRTQLHFSMKMSRLRLSHGIGHSRYAESKLWTIYRRTWGSKKIQDFEHAIKDPHPTSPPSLPTPPTLNSSPEVKNELDE
ncbi:hypothetical protein HZH66_008592 [Vespula vulgaris]|uniref:Uncharacterized protein n=1 Tax=Vespula vulgaris TaxID=7454 RepID=A0A834JTK8_VESVU|nr:hypothetical protein HZH66_008592 [Vespula vulgaris]